MLSTVGPKGLMMLSKPLVGTAAKMVLRSKLRMHANCSVEEFEEKMNRGIADTRNKRSMAQFEYHDVASNEVEDRTILEIK